MAIKKRTVSPAQAKSPEDIEEAIAKFANQADGADTTVEKELSPNDIRDFKAIRLPFNEYEYTMLSEGARLTGRTKLNFLRYAMLEMVKDLQKQHR